MKALMIDNYDSFTYNLVHMLHDLGVETTVHRNNDLDGLDIQEFDAVILSPGPGIPEEAGSLMSALSFYDGRTPVLGICLGHQAIAQHVGAEIHNMSKVYHGVSEKITLHDRSGIFQQLPEELDVGRYHSWIVTQDTLPDNVKVTATDSQDQIMAIECPERKLYGVQFHPESILTKEGKGIIKNFLSIAK